MHRQFIAAIAAASIMITTLGAAPARADQDDVARALAIILGLAVIGSVLSDDDDDRRPVYRTQPRHQPPIYRNDRHHPKPRKLPRRVNRKLLPQDCLISVRTNRGNNARIFGQRCLERNYRFTNSLPRDCARHVRTHRGVRHGYGARCLNRHGYALARR